MKSLLESIRRLLVASIYIGGVILCGIVIKIFLDLSASQNEAVWKLLLLIVCTLIAMPALHKLLNWILLKDEKKAHQR